MHSRYAMIPVLVLLVLGAISEGVKAEIRTLEVLISAEAVTTLATSDTFRTECYAMAFDIPGAVTDSTLISATLEFYADVSARSIGGWVNETPVIELYALSAPASDGVDESKFRKPSAAVRALPTGEGIRVVLDLTDIARAFLRDPEGNHEVVFGSFRGAREGRFAIRTGQFGLGTVGRMRFLYRHERRPGEEEP